MDQATQWELESCPDCRGPGVICHEGDWCVSVECLDCGAHTVYLEYHNETERESAECQVVAIWNRGKVIHMNPGE